MILVPNALQRMVRVAAALLRVSLYFAAVGVVLGCFGARLLWAKVQNDGLKVSDTLAATMGRVDSPYYDVTINGEVMHVATTWTDKPRGVLLDGFEKMCTQHTGGLAEEMAALPEKAKSALGAIATTPIGLGVLKADMGPVGFVACLVRESSQGFKGLVSGLEEFGETGNLSVLGELRYLTVRESEQKGKSVVILAWTTGAFRLGKMFPDEGDAPGFDPPNVKRIDGSKRLLTAGVQKAPFQMSVYDVASLTPEQALDFYRDALPAEGWVSQDVANVPLAGQGKLGLVFSRGPVDAFISTAKTPDGHTVVTVLSIPPRRLGEGPPAALTLEQQ